MNSTFIFTFRNIKINLSNELAASFHFLKLQPPNESIQNNSIRVKIDGFSFDVYIEGNYYLFVFFNSLNESGAVFSFKFPTAKWMNPKLHFNMPEMGVQFL